MARKRRGRPPFTQTQRIINAVGRGHQDGKSIARNARVPYAHVHPILSRLRREGRVAGFAGNLKVVSTRRRR